MKKTYKVLAGLIALSSVFSLSSSAQLSGIYTINNTLPMGAGNYTSFTAFAAVINTAGISGPVTVNVAANTGPYVEQVEFTAIAGTNSTNTITLNGNGNTITFSSNNTNAPHTILLTGTDYLTVNSLTVVGTGATFAMPLHLWSQANNNRFNGCRFEAPINVSGAKQVPVSMSGAASVVTTLGNSGNDNVWSGCTTRGGLRSFSFYGSTSAPYNTGNQILNCNITDFYQYGVYIYYTPNMTVRGNIMERLNQTSFTTTYAFYLNAGSDGVTIDKNRVRRMFDASPASSSALYGYYIVGTGQANNVNVFSNNLISDITSNGTIYGIYDNGYSYNHIINNSIILDNTVSTSGTIYGIYTWANNATNQFRNNLISINRTGSGSKYCIGVWYPNQFVCNNNIYSNTSPAGANYIGYNMNAGVFYSTFASWQSGTSSDLNGASANPQFNNPGIYDYTPTNPVLNNVGAAGLGITTDINNLARNLPAPDAGAFEFFNTPCATVSGTNAVVSPTNIICPNVNANLTLANSYTVNGLTFTWGSATNLVGPYVPIAGATLAAYVTPTTNTSTYYNVIIGCINGGQSVTATAGLVQIAGTTTNTVPYFEGFEGISVNKELPNCSWSRSDANQCGSRTSSVSVWRQARTGNKFGEFDNSNGVYSQTRYFYTNGIYLYPGITYSAALWYNTPGYTSWNNLTIHYGLNQSQAGLTQIASISGIANTTYESLSNTFTVATPGLYYIAISAFENGYGSQVVWDDLSITIPCSIPSNGAPLVVTGASTVCAGQGANFVASGAGTYTWSTGPNTNTLNPTPQFNTTYTVTGTNTLSGCQTSIVRNVIVHQLPPVAIAPTDMDICAGESVTLYGVAANSYTWSEGPTMAPSINVSPLTTKTYTLIGTNVYGCVGTATQQIIVNQAPPVTVSGNTLICEGSAANLTASGAGAGGVYVWTSNSIYLQSPIVSLTPNVTSIYTVSGVDANNCKGTAVVVVAVDPCTGLQAVNGTANKVSVYPNPSNGVFTVELNNGLNKTINVLDVTGRVVLSSSSVNNLSDVNISDLSNGIYYIHVKSENISEVLKVVKQ